MLIQLIAGIAALLDTSFEGKYATYANDVEQCFTQGSFFIMALQPTRDQLVGVRYKQVMPLDISYFPPVEGDNLELLCMSERLFSLLECVPLANGEAVRGRGLNAEIVDGVLHVQVVYTVILEKPVEEIPMETVSIDTGLKKG